MEQEKGSERKKNLSNEVTERVYHYTSPVGLKGIMAGTLRFTDVEYLNDKCELREIDNILDEVMSGLAAELEYVEDIKRIMELNINENPYCQRIVRYTARPSTVSEYERRYYICCMSTEKDAVGMWNYYTKGGNGEGYNIGFNRRQLFDSFAKKIDFQMDLFEGEVVYEKSKKKERLCELISTANAKINSYIIHNKIQRDSELYMEYLCDIVYGIRMELEYLRLFFKGEGYSHEKEYRYVLHARDDLEDAKKEYFIKKGVITPYYLIGFEANLVKSIGISSLVEFDLAKRGVIDFINHLKLKPNKIEIFRSNTSLRY